MPFEGFNIRKILPNADLDRLEASLRTAGDASPGSRKTGLAQMALIEDREEFARERQFEEEQRRNKLEDEFRKTRFAEGVEQYKASSDPRERAALRGGLVLQMHKMGAGADDMDIVLNELDATPLAESEEDADIRKQKLKDKSAHSGEVFNKSTPESQQEYLNALDASIPEGSARKLLVPAPDVKTVGSSSRLVEVARGDDGKTNAKVLLGADPARTGSKEAMRARSLDRLRLVEESVAENPDSLSSMMRLAQAQADVAVAEGRMTPSGKERIFRGIKKVGGALTSFDSAADEALDILGDDSRAAAAAVAGDLSRGFLSMSANVQSLAALIPGISPDVDLDEGRWSNQINDLAGDNAVLRSALFSIALSNAVAQGLANGRLTNKAIELAMQDVAANARSPAQIRNKLGEVRRRLATNLRRKLEVELGDFSAFDKAEAPLNEGEVEELDIFDDALSAEDLQIELDRVKGSR